MKFGAHESIKGGVYAAIERARDATCDVVQIFNKSNSQWRARKLEDAEVERYFELSEERGIAVVCSHSSYLINLASPDPTLNEKSYKSFEEEVRRCNRLEIPNLVFHPGSHVGSGEEAGMDRIGENLNRALDQVADNKVTLCLEATAGQGSNLGYTFEQLAGIIDRVENQDQMGVCLDTCHIFAAGYPISEPADYKKTMGHFDQVIGLKRLKVLHLNDSKKEFNSRRDRHEHIGEGHIGLDAFRNIVNDRKLARIPLIIETPKEEDLEDDRKNLKVLRSLVKKVPARRR
jgi:deoxyribonuclease-4